MTVTFKDLFVWQKSVHLVVEIYRVTETFPTKEQFSLTSQIRRAAVSIPSNIAEGKQRQTSKEFAQFLYISFGSCAEVFTQLTIARELNYISPDESERIMSELSEIEKMLGSLIRKIKASP